MTTSDWALQPPVVASFPAADWHLVLRELVYAVSAAEAVRDDVVRTADPRRDAWALATTERLVTACQALDRVLELLNDGQARSGGPARRSR